jgi:hypothetical protein
MHETNGWEKLFQDQLIIHAHDFQKNSLITSVNQN